MQRRICPICDHPIKYGHYCSFCKQWIRNPNYVNATYYLNERHPAHETDCEYHNAGSASWETSARKKSEKEGKNEPCAGNFADFVCFVWN